MNINNLTKLLYMEDSYVLQEKACVVEMKKDEAGKDVIVLDQTFFYPQGGGQPYDIGSITSESAVFRVQEVRFIEGLVHHIGFFEKGSITVGEQVVMAIDETRRLFNRRNHTSGHLIDIAIKQFDPSFIPIKGFHFPQGAYVEYQGLIDELKKTELLGFLQKTVKELIQSQLAVKTQFVSKNELAQYCDFVPPWLPEDKPIRIVQIGENKAHPCGGTHVKNTSEIGNLVIEKVTNKKGNTRISYSLQS